jgi:hypothetical protein
MFGNKRNSSRKTISHFFSAEQEALKDFIVLLLDPHLWLRNESWNYLHFQLHFEWYKSTIEAASMVLVTKKHNIL